MAAPKGNCFNPKGRPKKPINWTEFEDLCHMQCTQAEIANWFKMDTETLRLRVRDNYKEDYPIVYKRYADGGKASLRRIQFKLAHKNTAMAIWLGKQWLDQKDQSPHQMIAEEVEKKFDAVMDQFRRYQAQSIPGMIGSSNLSAANNSISRE